jgi:hypothetical protein
MAMTVVQMTFPYTFAYTDVRQQPELLGSSYEEEKKLGDPYDRIGIVATSP